MGNLQSVKQGRIAETDSNKTPPRHLCQGGVSNRIRRLLVHIR